MQCPGQQKVCQSLITIVRKKILNVINSKVKLGTALSVYDTGVKLHFGKNM